MPQPYACWVAEDEPCMADAIRESLRLEEIADLGRSLREFLTAARR